MFFEAFCYKRNSAQLALPAAEFNLRSFMEKDVAIRLVVFVAEQKKHWKRLRRGIMPDPQIINGWIESCNFALEDLQVLFGEALKK